VPVYKAEGVVLGRRNLGEADRILTLFTREFGRLQAKAKAVRKTTSRLAGRLEPFTHASFLLARGKAVDVVAQVEVVEGHGQLRADLRRLGYAWLVAELVVQLVPEGEPHPEVFRLLVETLRLLEHSDPAVAAAWCGLRLFGDLGYRPSTDRCPVCGRPPAPRDVWSPRFGGFTCGPCASEDPRAARLGGEAGGAARFLLQASAQEAGHLRVSASASGRLVAAVVAYAEARADRPLRSARIVQALEGPGPQETDGRRRREQERA
jgi:DNA repair protein RecO (recombination protein O)